MFRIRLINYLGIAGIALWFSACKIPSTLRKTENRTVPASYASSQDTTNTAKVKWNHFFKDPNLQSLIDTALRNNQELNIILQEINISRFEVKARKGAYLPFVNIRAGAGVDKVGKYTRLGAVDGSTEIQPGKKIPNPYGNFIIGPTVSWQVDIWKQLRNSRKAAWYKYLATTSGKNFMVTNLVAEMANSYFELMALDNQLDILKQNIAIQQNALEIVKQEKNAARVTELAVRRFEAEVAKNQSRQYYIKQQITETENRINFLAGRFPQPIERSSQTFTKLVPDSIQAGIPFQLLENRPDIKQAELDLTASKLDVKVAKANFYPGLFITGGVGLEAFNPALLVKAPESILMYLAGDLVAPLINRNAIKANYYSANARQVQSVYNYERAILRGYIEVANQLSNINNLENSFNLKNQQVQALNRSIEISTGLFKSARADYMEVLLTQRDAMESRFELIETKKQQMNAMVNIYQALGGGW
jgi:NodT family efflux transporter outer membrane factor (OMF) lipoprotein